MSKVKVNIDMSKVKKSIESEGKKGIKKAAETLLKDSNARVPADTGKLKKSGRVKTGSSGMNASVEYTSEYAVFQHENTRLKHKNGGEAKFLEKTLKENKEKYARIIADEIKGALK